MPVSYFDQTAYAGPIAESAINQILRDQIIADGGVPVRTTAAQMLLQDTFPRLLEQAFGLTSAGGRGWAANARAVTGAATILAATDDGMFIDQDVNAAPAAANLPAAAALRQGFNCVIRKSDASANAITLTPNGADTVTGPTTINTQFEALFVARTGATAWKTFIIPSLAVNVGSLDNAVLRASVPPGTIQSSSLVVSDVAGAALDINTPAAAAATTIRVTAGLPTGDTNGGGITISGAAAGATSTGGAVSVNGGIGGATSGAGGGVAINGGAATNGNSTGGAVAVNGGAGQGTLNGGAVSMTGGTAGAQGDGGAASVTGGLGGSFGGGGNNGGTATLAGGAAVGTGNNGGAATVVGGAGVGDGTGGAVNINGGAAGATGVGGGISIVAADGGAGATGGNGGSISINGGLAQNTLQNRVGGAVAITSGSSTGSGTGGAITISGGSGGGVNGAGAPIQITAGSAGGGVAAGGSVTIEGGNAAGGAAEGAVNICSATNRLGFFGLATAVVKQTITGAKADAVATSILNALVAYGMVIDGTT